MYILTVMTGFVVQDHAIMEENVIYVSHLFIIYINVIMLN